MKELALLICCTGILLCTGCDRSDKKLKKSEVRAREGEQLLSGSRMSAYEDGLLLWQLVSEKMYRRSGGAGVEISPVYMDIFDELGRVSTVVEADSGVTSDSLDSFRLWGGVEIRTDDGKRILSRSLNWEKDDRLLTSEAYVEIRLPSGERIRGKGFDAAEDFSWWTFHKDVEAEFSDFESFIGIKDDSISD
ncbi:MAG: LPS export ABC transporter periplasmic protein LptC [Fibrobacterota bacterium]